MKRIVKKAAAIFLCAACAISCLPMSLTNVNALQSATTTVTPTEISDPITNPDMGWVYIVNAIPGHTDIGRAGNFSNINNVAVLSCWKELEPVEGQYNWSLVDEAINYWGAQQGKRIHFRISTDAMIISGYGYASGAPDWLDTNYRISYQTRSDQGVIFKLYDYTNTTYKTKLSNFLAAFANHYKDNPYLDVVDLLGYGTWGEWHSGHDFANLAQRESTLQDIINRWYTAWQEKKTLAISCSYEWRTDMVPNCSNPTSYSDYKAWSAFDYALTKPKLTFMRNGIAGAMKTYDSRFLTDFFNSGRKLPVVLEFFAGYTGYRDNAIPGYTPDTAMNEAMSFHPNYLTMMGWDADSGAPQFYSERPDLIDKGNQNLGYRFVMSQASYPQDIPAGGSFTVNQTWLNRAVGRCFNKYPLKVSLTDSNGNEVWSGVDNNFDQTSFMKGGTYNISSSFALDGTVPSGNYDLRIAMVDGSGNPKINLAIAGKDTQGRYKIGTVRVTQNPESFESGSFAATNYKAAQVNSTATISGASGTVINGAYSVDSGNVAAATEWAEFLHSDTAKLKLSGKGTYKVSFTYKVLSQPAQNGYFDFLARSDTGGVPNDKGLLCFNDATNAVGTKTSVFTLNDYNDYYLNFGMHWGGRIAIDDIKIIKIQGFESGSLAGTNLLALSSGIITADTDKIIEGTKSFYGSTNPSVEWSDFLKTDNTKYRFEPNASYRVTFDYKACSAPGPNGFYQFFVRSDAGGYANDLATTRWTDAPGNTGTKSIVFTVSQYTDYSLVWGLHNGGGYSVDNIQIEKLTNGNMETFEDGGLQYTNFKAGTYCSLTNDPTKTITQNYSVTSSSPTDIEWNEFLYSENTKLKLIGGGTYKVTFDYKVLSLPGANGYFDYFARTNTGGISEDKGFLSFTDSVGATGKKTVTFTLSNFGDYFLCWGKRFGGAISIDNIIVEKI